MEEGLFSGWLKQNGDPVTAGEPLFAVESDKVTMEVESLDGGILYVPPGAPETGAVVRVGQRLGFLLAPGEAEPETEVAAAPASVVAESAASAAIPSTAAAAPTRDGGVPVTPRARRAAAELGVDLTLLQGTGRDGRIRETDVRAAATAPSTGAPITALRRTIANRMMESRQTTAPVTLTTRAEATELVALRNQWKLAGTSPSLTDIVAKLVAIVLKSHPEIGGRWEGDHIVLPSQVHIGIAVDTPQGLLVPVLRDVAASSLEDVARRSRELIEAARARRLRAEDLAGGTFTITNLGGFGVDAFTPIINSPETAVLGLGAIRKEPAVLANGELGVSERITLSLTFDHRVVDGAPAARFLQALVRLIEAPPAGVRRH